MWRLQEILAELTGLAAVTLQPAAGSQGELLGLMLIRAYHAERGETGRDEVIVPDTAHGTNPASVTMAGFTLVKVGDGRAREHRPRRPAGEGVRADGRADAHEPVDPRAVRRGDPRASRAPCTRPGGSATTTARTSTRSAASRGRATWGSTSSTSTCTRRSRSRTAAAGRAAGRSRCGTFLEPYLPVPVLVRREDGQLRPRRATARSSIGKVRGLRGAVRGIRARLRVHARLRAGAARDVRDGGAERELPARPAAGRLRASLRPALHARVRPLGARS